MKKDFIFTFVVQFFVLISGILVFRLAMSHFGEVGFSEYSLVKRNLGYIYTIAYFGMGITIPRYISMEIGKKSGKENEVFVSSLYIFVIILILLAFISLFLKDQLAYLLFGNIKYSFFIFPIYISIVGLVTNGAVYAYYRGKMLFKKANLLQLINIGLIPIIVFLIASNVRNLFIFSGLAMTFISMGLLIKIYLSIDKVIYDKNIAKSMFFYAIQRIPGDFALSSLIALPAIFASHSSNVITAGYVAFSISLLNLSAQVIAPVGLIMLPKISHLLGEKKYALIKYYVWRLLWVAVTISLFGTILYQLFAKEILSIYLNQVSVELVNISKNIMWGTLFYPIYVGLRSVIDAYYKFAYNTVSVICSLIFFLISYLITHNIYNSLIIALTILSFMTIYFIKPLLFKSLK